MIQLSCIILSHAISESHGTRLVYKKMKLLMAGLIIGTPDGAAALRRVLLRLKTDDAVWLTDTDAILKAAGLK